MRRGDEQLAARLVRPLDRAAAPAQGSEDRAEVAVPASDGIRVVHLEPSREVR